MIPNNSSGLKTSGTLVGEQRSLTLDPRSAQHLMSMFIDLYEDPILALVREYSVNALDAHRAVGNTDPIEVDLPKALRPYLVIRDRGIGMSSEDIIQTYTAYGASTKRNSNNETGMYGIGSKSALTYTDQFTVRAVKNGMATSILVSRLDTGEGVYNILEEAETGESNGVEIFIPVKDSDFDTFKSKAQFLFGFWKAGEVLLDGEAPDFAIDAESSVKLTDDIYMVPSDSLKHSIVVMGNVPYRATTLDSHLGFKVTRSHHVVYFADMAEVDIAPNREGLMETPQTAQVLKDVASETIALYREKAIEDILSKPTLERAWNKWEAINRSVYFTNFQNIVWNGIPLETNVKGFSGLLYNTRSAKYQVSKVGRTRGVGDRINVASLMRGLRVTGLPADMANITPSVKAKARHYILNSSNIDYVVFCDDGLSDETLLKYLDEMPQTITWDDLLAVKVPRTAPVNVNRRKVDKGNWDFYDENGDIQQNQPLPTDVDIYYGSPSALNRPGGHKGARFETDFILDFIPSSSILVRVAANRQDKFVRDYPKAKPFEDFLKVALSDVVKKIDTEALAFDNLPYYEYRAAETLEVIQDRTSLGFLDPDLLSVVEFNRKRNAARIGDQKVLKADAYALSVWVGKKYVAPQAATLEIPPIDDILAKYPLLNRAHPRESVEYANLIYKNGENNDTTV